MRWLFEARLVNDAFGAPALYVDFRDERRALLFDFGDISVLPPRKRMRLSHVFVTHTHMDQSSGFDHLLRVVLGRKAQFEHKLRAYTWNVVSTWRGISRPGAPSGDSCAPHARHPHPGKRRTRGGADC